VEEYKDVRRLLQPNSIAIAGLGAQVGPRHKSVARMIKDGRQVYIINPNRPVVMGIDTYPTLTAIGKPVDAVVSLISAEPSTELVEEASTLDIGGVVVIAAGFVDSGGAGLELQGRIAAATHKTGMPVLGPNCLGYANIRSGVSLARRISDIDRPGGISVVSQSGSMMRAVTEVVNGHRYLGLSALLSVGNEAVTDMADYVNFLAGDPHTDAIVLVIETIRRPKQFFEAVRLATGQGKVIVAIKLGRNERSQQMAASHTGALAGDSWVYEVALSQAGIIMALDPEEAIDRLQFLVQLPPRKWAPLRNVGILTSAGGMAALAVDVAAEENVTLPSMVQLVPWLKDKVPGVDAANPLDVPELFMNGWADIVAKYESCSDVDALVFFHIFADEDEEISYEALKAFAEIGSGSAKPFVISMFSAALPGTWVDNIPSEIAVGRGLRSTLRGLNTLRSVGEYRARFDARTSREEEPLGTIDRVQTEYVSGPEGPMLPFVKAMQLISEVGIPIAPFEMISGDAELNNIRLPFDPPYVVKLADVAHRSDIGAVRTNVGPERLTQEITSLRDLGARHGTPIDVAIQPQVDSSGEVFVGIQVTELGPLVVFGLGGIFVNVLKRVGGRIAPFGEKEAHLLLEEFADLEVVHGFRGQSGWNLEELARLLVGAGRLAASAADWIESVDINPLVNGPSGFVAVDALCLVK
jgi:acyl-CoA synthetase (NDP forming)